MASTRMPAQALKRLAAFQWATEIGMSTPPIAAPAEDTTAYTQLLPRRLTEWGYRQAFASITQQRHPSIHRVLRARNPQGTAGQDDRMTGWADHLLRRR
jgi:hypothetical protein